MKLADVITKTIKKFTLPENVNQAKEEGSDGHLVWDVGSKKTLVLMNQFTEAVLNGKREEVQNIFEGLFPEPAKAQVQYLTYMVLQRKAEKTKEALLSAICAGSRPAVEFILCLFHEWSWEERAGCCASSAFPRHLTPLVLACILNNFAIVECLLLRGHYIQPIHHRTCICTFCLRMPPHVLNATARIDILRATCSDSFLWLGTDDPFAAACAMALDLDDFLADDNMECVDWFRNMKTNVQQFNARLVDQHWTNQELDILLSTKQYSTLMACEDPYPRLQMAINGEMRDMISNTNMQRAVDEIWQMGWGTLNTNNHYKTFQKVLVIIFFYPMSLLYIISNGKLSTALSVPLGRFLANCASYIFFLVCLLIGTFEKSEPGETASVGPLLCQIFVYVYVAGVLTDRQLQLARYGFHNYQQFWWRKLDFVFLGSFLFAMQTFMINKLIYSEHQQVYHSHRRHWSSFDTNIFYEITLCFCFLFSALRIFYYIQLQKNLGATIISSGKCLAALRYFFGVIALVLIAFTIGINFLVRPYAETSHLDDNGEEAEISDYFTSYGNAITMFYWGFFGYLEPGNYDIVVGNSGPDFENVEHGPTQTMTVLIVAIYHVLVVVTLLNLMISVLVQKASVVLEHEESEYRYTRMAIYVEYTHWTSAVPPPLNILYVFKEYIRRSISDKYVFHWPEFVLQKDLVLPNADIISREYDVYMHIMVKAFQRYRSTNEQHYKNVFRTEFGNNDDKKSQLIPKVAFLNCFDAETQVAKKETDFFHKPQSRPKKSIAVTPTKTVGTETKTGVTETPQKTPAASSK